MPASNFSFLTFIRNAVILFAGVMVAAWLMDSIQAESTTTLILVAIVLAVLNTVLRPILILFALPFVVFTLGFGILLINAVLLYLAGQLVPGFTVPTFGQAFLGSLIISLVSLIVNVFLAPRPKVRVQWSTTRSPSSRPSKGKIREDDVIDV